MKKTLLAAMLLGAVLTACNQKATNEEDDTTMTRFFEGTTVAHSE